MIILFSLFGFTILVGILGWIDMCRQLKKIVDEVE